MLKIYTISDLSEKSNLGRFQILKHINGQTLKARKKKGKYEIEENDLRKWIDNIPSIDEIEHKSFFCRKKIKEYKTNEFIEEVDVRNIVINKEYKFADLFCGAGGLSIGLVKAGYRPILYADVFKDALLTYKKNIINKFDFVVEQGEASFDISKKTDKEKIIGILKKEKPDLIVGGFPCQGFSLSGTSVATDPRNTLYMDMLEIVKNTQPSYILMENVIGILSMLNGMVVKKIISDYHSIGYNVSYKVLNSMDYGVAQSRNRVIFIGNRIDYTNPYPKKTCTNYKTVREELFRFENMPSNSEINHVICNHSPDMKKRLLEVNIGESLYPNFSDSWRKCDPDKPSCTIKENHGATNIHYSLPRVITAREMAALQSFSDDFIFCGSKGSQLKQIGNAVPPEMSKNIGLAIRTKLDLQNNTRKRENK